MELLDGTFIQCFPGSLSSNSVLQGGEKITGISGFSRALCSSGTKKNKVKIKSINLPVFFEFIQDKTLFP
jgi:hypothetical protein